MTEFPDVPHGAQPVVPRNGLGTASLVVGIIALVASVSVCGGVVMGVVATLLGITARRRAKRGRAGNRGTATAGIVLGVAAVVISLTMILFWNWTGVFNEDYQRCLDQLKNQQYCEETFK